MEPLWTAVDASPRDPSPGEDPRTSGRKTRSCHERWFNAPLGLSDPLRDWQPPPHFQKGESPSSKAFTNCRLKAALAVGDVIGRGRARLQIWRRLSVLWFYRLEESNSKSIAASSPEPISHSEVFCSLLVPRFTSRSCAARSSTPNLWNRGGIYRGLMKTRSFSAAACAADKILIFDLSVP
ncbi:Hypothetical predicted protein [Cloeon dipterum]|uniref:Uncharacterized protein n=1 Tax=Cloeon dipterum TaxID=197152 RepID=A0A8S1CUG4_9INSE|nr:Hypothetical predicted protein [Cloeon dipterum]